MPVTATNTKRRSIPFGSLLLFVSGLLSGCSNSSGPNSASRNVDQESFNGANLTLPTTSDRQSQGQTATTPAFTDGNVPSRGAANSGSATSSTTRVVTLSISVSGFESVEGECRIAIYGDAKSFNKPDKALFKDIVRIEGNAASWKGTVELPMGIDSIGVAAYHDRNSNETLDKNSFGIPTERYGFSNDPKRGFGPPKFLETAVSISEELLELAISIR